MKNSKALITVIILIIITIISTSIIYIHNISWIKTNHTQKAETVRLETETYNKFRQYNSERRNNLFLMITYNEDFYSKDSILSKIAVSKIKIDSIIFNSDFFYSSTQGEALVQGNDSLLLLMNEILKSYYNGEIKAAKYDFLNSYSPLYIKTDKLCEELILNSVQKVVYEEEKMEETKGILMKLAIGVLALLLLLMICILIITSISDKKRRHQKKEIEELNLKNRLSQETINEDKKFQAAIQSAGFGMIDWHFDNDLPEVSDKWLEIFDVKREDLLKYGVQIALDKINSIPGLTTDLMKERFLGSQKSEFYTVFSIINSKAETIWIEGFDFVLERDKNNIPCHVFGFINDITKRKNFEIKNLESRRLLNAVSKAGRIGHWEFDISKPKPTVSDEWLEVFNITREEYDKGEYSDWIKNMHIDSQAVAIQNHREIKEGIRKNFCTEYLYNHPVKGEIWIEGYGEVTDYDSNGKVLKYIGYHQDITRRKEREEEAIKTATELKSWYKNMNLAFCVCERVFDKHHVVSDFRYLFVNEEFCNIVNISEKDIINRCAGEFLHSAGESVMLRLNDLFNNKSVRFEVYDSFLKKHFEIFAFSITDNKFAMLYSDVSERFRLQTKIAEEQKYYRQLFEMSRDAIFIIDSTCMTFIDANESCVKLFGADKKADLLAVKYSMLYPAKQINGESSSALLKMAIKNIDKTGEEHYDWRFRKIDGQEFIGQIRFTKIEYGNSIAYLGIVRDTTQIYNTHENLERTRHWLQTIIDSLNSVVVVKDNYGKIIASNQTYNTTFGISKEFVTGKKSSDIYRPDEAKAIQAIDDEIIYLGISRTYEQKLTTAENKQQIFLVTKTPLKDHKGNVYAVVAQGTDITTIKALEQKLRVAQQKAIAANKAKSSFLANMSHEIRTPMNAIIGFAEILQKKLRDPDHKEYINSIFTAGNTLLNLINDILDLSKIEAGKIELRQVYCDLEILKSNILEIFSLKTEEKGLNFSVEYQKQGDFLFFIDENRLRQVLINIVGNAVKFTEKGFVKVVISMVPEKNNTVNLIISVEDSGIGIAADELEEIFNPFSQSENIDDFNVGGTGLGLSICNQLIGLMDGKIEVESELQKGSKFIITIPEVSYETTESGLSELNPVFSEYVFNPAKILIVDDVKPNRDVLTVHLRDYHFDVYEASSGSQALEMLENLIPDLIIIDLRMPDISGIEVTKIIRKSEKLSSVKIIAYTAALNFAMLDGELNSMFDGLILKPATKLSLTKELTRMLDYEELTMETDVTKDGFAFSEMTVNLIKDTLASVSAVAGSRLTNRQITELLLILKQSKAFEDDEELKRYVQALAKSVEDFNVILIEHLTGILFLTNEK